jgi:hypothetical protein
MSAARLRGVSLLSGICCVLTIACLLFVFAGGSDSLAGDKKNKPDTAKAYKLYQAKCLSCHSSVADPEKPGRTRDGWFVVVNMMHKQGLKVTPDESATIVDFLYAIRKGLEKEPG